MRDKQNTLISSIDRVSLGQKGRRAILSSGIVLAALGLAAVVLWSVGSLRDVFSKTQSRFLIPSHETSLKGFVQIASEKTPSSYRVNFRGLDHHSATVALLQSQGDELGKCIPINGSKPDENTIPFRLSDGRGVVFSHSTSLKGGGQIGWMQLLYDDHGSCLEISAKGISDGELQPQDLILLLSSLQREPRS